jgi:hypothetical protein
MQIPRVCNVTDGSKPQTNGHHLKPGGGLSVDPTNWYSTLEAVMRIVRNNRGKQIGTAWGQLNV